MPVGPDRTDSETMSQLAAFPENQPLRSDAAADLGAAVTVTSSLAAMSSGPGRKYCWARPHPFVRIRWIAVDTNVGFGVQPALIARHRKHVG